MQLLGNLIVKERLYTKWHFEANIQVPKRVLMYRGIRKERRTGEKKRSMNHAVSQFPKWNRAWNLIEMFRIVNKWIKY